MEKYFQPSEEDKEQGLKLPTKAHHAIARMVAGGFVKVIVTTNFDRLLELALTDAGVQPTVISSPVHAAGATPITHSGCTIVKVHGDYMSADLKNTVDELAGYDAEIDTLLDEVFDQYGLVVCGWSAEWDKALRDAILRSPGRRFATYWLHRGRLKPEAQEIVTHRDAIDFSIQDADDAFESLADKVESLREAIDQRPIDTAIAVTQLKKYLPDPVHRIKLHDLVMSATDEVIDRVHELSVNGQVGPQRYREQMQVYEEATAGLLKLLATGAFFSDRADHDQLLARTVDRLANRRTESSGKTVLLYMQQYPSLLCLYAIALGAAAANRLDSIARVLGTVSAKGLNSIEPVAVAAASWHVLDPDWVKRSIDGFERRKTPVSDHLLAMLRPAMLEIVREDEQFEGLFDETEFLIGLAFVSGSGWDTGPVGRAAWRLSGTSRRPGAMVERNADLLIAAGVFESTEHLDEIRVSYEESFKSSRWW